MARQVLTFAEAGIQLIDCVHKTPEARDTGFSYVAIPQMKNGHIDFTDARKISETDFVAWTRKAKPQKYDVILSRRTNPGVTAVDRSHTPFALGQNLVILRSNGERVYPPYLRWICNSPDWWEQIDKYINVGAVFSSLRCGDVPKFEIPLPPIKLQKDIAGILDALDDKIELNRKTSATLEAMARALYRSWFVDFDPVNAKAEGRAPAHMDAPTAALFPQTFTAGIPEGWKSTGLDNIASFVNGAALQKYPAQEGEPSLPVIKIAELRNGVTANTGKAAIDVPDKFKIANGDVIFSWSGSLLLSIWAGGNAALNQHLFKTTSSAYPKWFYYFSVDNHMSDFREIAASKATTMGHIQRHHLTEAEVIVPPPDILNAATGIVEPIFEKMFALMLESQTLAQLRDTLLPRLMSGELRVKAAEEMIEEAL